MSRRAIHFRRFKQGDSSATSASIMEHNHSTVKSSFKKIRISQNVKQKVKRPIGEEHPVGSLPMDQMKADRIASLLHSKKH